MEDYQGDLTDIFRAISHGVNTNIPSHDHDHDHNWFVSDHPLMDFPSSTHILADNTSFGDPFLNMRDPLLLQHPVPATAPAPAPASDYFSTIVEDASFSGGSASTSSSVNLGQSILEDEMKGSCSVFSRIQISSCSDVGSNQMAEVIAGGSPTGIKPAATGGGEMNNVNVKSCLVDNTTSSLQISSPRNLGIKRRKSQVKKVVCIPAPAAANSRSSGEVVPSDLWAWRKYGQKPIKGSPYPRGYYRCSSSKGCSARKQVERSRTDPNMLVITYTSEHNHPWPTQRNALAGSTRSQPSKTNNSKTSSSSSSPPENNKQLDQISSSTNDLITSSPVNPGGGGGSCSATTNTTTTACVKEEFEMDDDDREISQHGDQDDQTFNDKSYKPALLPDHHTHQAGDYLVGLDELESDPLNLLLSQGFNNDDDDDDVDDPQKDNKNNKTVVDPFSDLFDWAVDSNTNNNRTCFGQPNNTAEK